MSEEKEKIEEKKEESNKEKELIEKLIEELEDLRHDLLYKSDDIRRVIDKIQRTVDIIDTEISDDDDNGDPRETPWYLENERESLLKMIEELDSKSKEINGYRIIVELIKKYIELVRDKLNGQLNVDDLSYVAKVSIDYGYMTVKFNNIVHLASRPLTSKTSIVELMTEAVDLANIRGIIVGTLFNLGIAEGRDEYDGKYNDIREYVADRLKYILDLLKAQ